MEDQHIQNVIILGAGASKSEGAPLQGELIKTFFEYLDTNPERQDKEYWKGTLDYFEKFWGINIDNYKMIKEFPTFEECLAALDLAIYRDESFRKFNKSIARNTRKSLIYLIARMLDYKIQTRREVNHHRTLLKILQESGELEHTAFVSLNYDIIIDNAILNMRNVTMDGRIDYGIKFLEQLNNIDFFRKGQLLLKPHGSLNWLYCPTCNSLEIRPRRKEGIKAFYRDKPCATCHTNMEPVIVPPTLYKEFRNPFIQEVYLKAEKVLRQADKIFICGYSFPDADFHIKYLLKRAELFKDETPEIYIMNSHKENEREKERFLRFFRYKEKVHYTNFSFEQFSQLGIKGVLDRVKNLE